MLFEKASETQVVAGTSAFAKAAGRHLRRSEALGLAAGGVAAADSASSMRNCSRGSQGRRFSGGEEVR